MNEPGKNQLNDPDFLKRLSQCFRHLTISLIGILVLVVFYNFSYHYITQNIDFFHEHISPIIIGIMVVMIFIIILSGCVISKTPEQYDNTRRNLAAVILVLFAFVSMLLIIVGLVHNQYKEKNYHCFEDSSTKHFDTKTVCKRQTPATSNEWLIYDYISL